MVEHRSLTQDDHSLMVGNLRETYLALARGVPGTRVLQRKSWAAALNDFPHPICNFAVCADVAELDVSQLLREISERRFFNLYVCPFRGERKAAAELARSGCSRAHSLIHLASFKKPAMSTGTLMRVDQPAHRKRLSDFMISQFFSTQTQEVRERISLATASALELEIYDLEFDGRNRPVGAVMLGRTEGVLGLYNLCVAPQYQGRGFGTSIVAAVQALAYRENVIVSLECESSLEPWYSKMGFQRVGLVDVYTCGFRC